MERLILHSEIEGAWRLGRKYELEQSVFPEDPNNEVDQENLTEDGVPISYVEFQSFLSLGCNGSPIEGYSTILVILSTIPPEVCCYTQLCRMSRLQKRLDTSLYD